MSEIFVKKYGFHRQIARRSDLCDGDIWHGDIWFLFWNLQSRIIVECEPAIFLRVCCVQRFKVCEGASLNECDLLWRYDECRDRLKTLNYGSSIIDVDHWSRTNDRLARVSPAYKNRRDRALLNDPLGRSSIHGIPDLKIQRDLSFYLILRDLYFHWN